VAHYFPFVQFEFTHSIGPPAGRYTVGEGAALGSADVVGIKVRGATARRPGILRRGAQDVADGKEPEDLSVIVATVVLGTAMLPDAGPGRELLAGAKASVEEQDRWIDRALGVLNRVVWAHRLCAADPYALDLTRADARATRIGYGPAESVVLGHWDAAIAVPSRRSPRVKPEERLMPMDAMTALLAGRAVALESEELILRAVLDLDHGRTRAAAGGIHAAHELLLGETEGAELPVAARERLDKVIESRERVSELARQARSGPLSEADVDRLRAVVEAIGAFVDVWRYQPLGYREPKVTT
jgi:hypothetical protein